MAASRRNYFLLSFIFNSLSSGGALGARGRSVIYGFLIGRTFPVAADGRTPESGSFHSNGANGNRNPGKMRKEKSGKRRILTRISGEWAESVRLEY